MSTRTLVAAIMATAFVTADRQCVDDTAHRPELAPGTHR